LSANEFALAIGGAAAGALATVVGDVTGMVMLGVAAEVLAAAKFVDEGGTAGVRPATATGCGVD
jgi:hypothetical protein